MTTYAPAGRTIFDADSHIMEVRDWLGAYADPGIRERLRPLHLGAAGGWMIEQAGDDLFLFSSDYPHPEGGRDPIKRFDRSLEGTSAAAVERFYSGNFADMMAMAPVPA